MVIGRDVKKTSAMTITTIPGGIMHNFHIILTGQSISEIILIIYGRLQG